MRCVLRYIQYIYEWGCIYYCLDYEFSSEREKRRELNK